jgi:hypothetical protein
MRDPQLALLVERSPSAVFRQSDQARQKELLMSANRKDTERFGGEFMIQERDHMSNVGQVGGDGQQAGGQAQQSEGASRQQGDGRDSASGQQGGERRRTPRRL